MTSPLQVISTDPALFTGEEALSLSFGFQWNFPLHMRYRLDLTYSSMPSLSSMRYIKFGGTS